MKKSNSYNVLPSLLLLLVFLLCSMFTILIGGCIYENIRASSNAPFYSDTVVSYVTNKIRQADRAGSVETREIDGCSILVLSSSTNGPQCEIWVYILNGVLKELYAEKDSGLTVEDRPNIMGCISLDFAFQETTNRLTIHLETEPPDITVCLLFRSEPEGGVES